MRLPAKTKHLLLALMLTVIVPGVASAGFFSWWFGPPSDPVEDVVFSTVATCRPCITDLYFSSGEYQTTVRTKLLDTTTTAAVVSQQILIAPLSLTDNNGTTLDATFPLANLTTDKFGSSFRSNVTLDVTTNLGPYSLTGRASGRITEKNGLYYLTANICAVQWEDLNSTDGAYHIIKFCLRGTVAVPVTP